MSPTIVFACIGVAIQLGLGIFYYGKLTEKTKANSEGIDKLFGYVDNHGQRISRLEGWRDTVEHPSGRSLHESMGI